MGAPFKVPLIADVGPFIKATQSVEQELATVADSLDQLATDTEANSKEAAEAIERRFSKAFDEVKTEARDTGRRMGTDIHDGARKAGDGIDEFKNEGKQSIRETAASFSDVTDALDLVQEVAANALSGFGPAGMAAGAAAAIGIGLVKTMLDDAAEKANKARQATADLAGELIDVKGNPAALDWADKLKTKLLEVVNSKEWYEFWEADNGPSTRLEEWSTKAKKYGLDMHDVVKMAMGDKEAEARITDQLNAKQAEHNRLVEEANRGHGVSIGLQDDLTAGAGDFLNELKGQNGEVQRATDLQKLYNESVDDTAAAQKRATDATQTFTDNLTDNLSVADEGLDKFVHKGKLSLEEWSKELANRAKQNTRIKDFTVDVDTKLSPEALENFEKLPTETQAQIAKAYRDGGKGDKKQILTNLEAEAKVTKVTVDTSGAKATPVEIPTTVISSGAVQGTAEAAGAAQREADKTDNVIEFKTRIDKDELQRQVNRAAAAITPPTVYVKTKVKDEVP